MVKNLILKNDLSGVGFPTLYCQQYDFIRKPCLRSLSFWSNCVMMTGWPEGEMITFMWVLLSLTSLAASSQVQAD